MEYSLSRDYILKIIKESGIVGGGGAGFPTHIKYNSRAETVIVNGAECEPLLRVDQQLMALKPEEIIEGLKIAMTVTGAERGVIALKGKYKDAIKALEAVLPGQKNISLHIMGNYYPAGDEQTLVYEVTGRIVPEGGIPLSVGAVVSNAVTLYNVFKASQGEPVTCRPLTVTGEVNNPVTLNVPVGTTIRDVLSYAGGVKIDNPVIIRGGPMMGTVTEDLEEPVMKTDSGLIVLPSDHYLVKTKTRDIKVNLSHTKMCEMCTYCTMLCPRYLLGHNLQPHLMMRIIGYGIEKASIDDLCQAYLCCQCGICSMVACPVDLRPREIYAGIVMELRRKNITNPHKRKELTPRPLMKLRRTSAAGLVTRLELAGYDVKAPWKDMDIHPGKVIIPLKQHTGIACTPSVKAGDRVVKGQIIGTVPEGATGAYVHASISGHVVEISNSIIIDGE